MVDSRNNKTVVRKQFNEFIHLAKAINKDIPQAKIEFPARGTRAFFQKLNKKFHQNRFDGASISVLIVELQDDVIGQDDEVHCAVGNHEFSPRGEKVFL